MIFGKKDKIAVYDSGIGGLSVLKRLKAEFPNNRFVYFGDNKNVPYGNKTEAELLGLVEKNVNDYLPDVAALVLACNTLSLCIAQKIRKIFPFKIFTVTPPLCYLQKSDADSIVFGTPRTISCLKKYSFPPNVLLLPLPDLAVDIENSLLNLDKVVLADHFCSQINSPEKIGCVCLSCTHYVLIKDKFMKVFPQAVIYDGIDALIENLRKNKRLLSITEEKSSVEIEFRGEAREKNLNFFRML